jgi:hypothetical protein
MYFQKKPVFKIGNRFIHFGANPKEDKYKLNQCSQHKTTSSTHNIHFFGCFWPKKNIFSKNLAFPGKIYYINCVADG